MNYLRMFNVVLLSACSAAGPAAAERSAIVPAVLCFTAVALLSFSLILRLAQTAECE